MLERSVWCKFSTIFMEGDTKKCGCPHHKVFPVLIVLFGLLFLLGQMNVVAEKTVSLGWPVLVILAGLFKFTKGMCKCCSCGVAK